MANPTFREKITALHQVWSQDMDNYQRNKDFWYVMDSIETELVMKWAERAVSIKNPIHGKLIPNEWQTCCNILNTVKNSTPKIELSNKQKRLLIFYIITMWHDLELVYYP